MRGIGNHTPPENMQPEPADNTSVYVMRQVNIWSTFRSLELGVKLIHAEVAREIAAWWQSPGRDGMPFAVFASTGTITEDLTDAITREIRDLTASDHDHDLIKSLFALLAYVNACQVTA